MAAFSSTKALIDAYNNGLDGTKFDERKTDEILASMPKPLFSQAADGTIKDSGKGKLALPYKFVQEFDPTFGADENQLTGDCFQAGTRVRMHDNTWKNIEDIKVGDFVLSHTNKRRKVLSLIKKLPSDGKIRKISLDRYKNEISCTNDHLILVKSECGFSWKRAEDLDENSYILLPSGKPDSKSRYQTLDMAQFVKKEDNDRLITPQINEGFIRIKGSSKKVSRFIEIDTDIGWLLGIYLAEGGIDNGRVDFSTNINEKYIHERICFIIKNKFNIDCKIELCKNKQNVTIIRCSSKILCSFFENFSNGNVWSKSIKNHENLPKSVKMEIIRGWIDGDGGFNKQRTRICGGTVSEELVCDLSELLIDCELQHKVSTKKAHKRSKQSYTVDVYSGEALRIFPECRISRPNPKNVPIKKQKLDKSEYGLLAKVKNTEEFDYSESVYCIEVEEEHSFIANGIAVHNCCSHGARNAVTISLVCDIKSRFEAEKYPGRLATEAIYGARGHVGEGMAVIFAMQYLQRSGIALRKKYGPYDLTKYNPNVGISWGRTGTPKVVTDETKANTIQDFALITTTAELRDSIYNGYGIENGSGIGFNAKARDKNGIVRRNGSWSHATCFGASDDTRQRSDQCLFLYINSWGPNYLGGPLWFGQPGGSFWITEEDAQAILNQKQTYAVSNVNGFPARDIDWSFLDDVL